MLHHPTTLAASTRPTKKHPPSKNSKQFDSLPSDLLHNIGVWHAGLVHYNKLKLVLEWPAQQNPVLCDSKPYKPKICPLWLLNAFRHNPLCMDGQTTCTSYIQPWTQTGKYKMIKHEPIYRHMTIREQSMSHLYKLLAVARYSVCNKIIKYVL